MNYITVKLALLRILAFIIDILVLLLVTYFLFFIGLPFFHSTSTNFLGFEINVFVTRVGPIISWFYHSIFECSSMQATIGKFLLRLKVSNTEFQRANFAQTTVRHFSKILSYFLLGGGFVMFFFNKNKQCLHDYLSSTIVRQIQLKNE